jgi:hypothetical protein
LSPPRISRGAPSRLGAAFRSCGSRPNNPFQEFPYSTPTPNAASTPPATSLSARSPSTATASSCYRTTTPMGESMPMPLAGSAKC